MGTHYHGFFDSSAGAAISHGEAITWATPGAGGAGVLDIDGVPPNCVRFIHESGDAPATGSVLTASGGRTRTLGTVSNAVFLDATYPGTWYQFSFSPALSGPFLGTPVTWSGGAAGSGGGVIQLGGSGSTSNFFHSAGRAPVIGDTVVGAGINVVVTAFTSSASGDVLDCIDTGLADEVVEVEWTTELSLLADESGPLRFMLTYLRPSVGGTFFQAFQNQVLSTLPDTSHAGDPTYPQILGRQGFFSAQFFPSINQKGLEQLVNPAINPPRWARHLFNGDGLGDVWSNFVNRESLPAGAKIRWGAKLVGFVTDPPGELNQDIDGDWIPLLGSFAKWEMRAEVIGSYAHTIGIYYLPLADASALKGNPFHLHQEQFTRYPDLANDLAVGPTVVRYSGFRARVGTVWHEVLRFKTQTTSHAPGDPKHGWCRENSGKVVLACGNPAGLQLDQLANRHFLTGLLYERESDSAPLASHNGRQDQLQQAGSSGDYRGPVWFAAGGNTLPYVQQEANRGFYILHPSNTDGAVSSFVAERAGMYSFQGDFAWANTSNGSSPDGVDVAVEGVPTPFLATLEPGVAVDPNAPFVGASNRHFSIVGVPLVAGDKVRFIVRPRAGSAAFAGTAFQLTDVSSVAQAPTQPTSAPLILAEPDTPKLQEYVESLRQLLPLGSIWRAETGTRLRQLLEALAGRLVAAQNRALGLLDEADPRTTTELITDWERVAGIPGPCSELGETLQQRRAALVQALTATGGASAAYFVALAASLGYSGVTITAFDPFRAGDPVGGAVTGDTIAFVWQVNVPVSVAITSFRVGLSVAGEPLRAWGNDQIECVFDHFKPAHTTILFAYGSA